MRMIGALLAVAMGAASAHAMPFERELGLPADYGNQRVSKMVAVEPGETVTLLETDGPGCVTHIWMTLGQNDPRRVVLRMYWDGETDPSVEAPLADFFGVGHNNLEPGHYFATPCLVVAPKNGYNIYMPMPFRKKARITITNDQEEPISDGGGLYFQADYVTYDSLSEDIPYFHAQWRREAPAPRRARPYTLLEAVGRGFIAGVTHHVRTDDASDKWFHGGGDILYLDGASAPKAIKGIGGEDFIGESWHSAPFNSPYAGCTNHKNGEISLYRFFLEGPPRFEESALFGFGAMANEITSVVYWYQDEPHHRFFKLPEPPERAAHAEMKPIYDVELLPEDQKTVAVLGPFAGDVETKIPLDGMTAIDFRMSMLTNYGLPYKETIPGPDNRRVHWERARTTLSWLDFDAIYKPKIAGIRGVQAMPGAVAYAYLSLESEGAGPCNLLLGYDDPLKLWLNGELLFEGKANAGFTGQRIALNLREGHNDVLIKVTNTWNENWAVFAISMQFTGTGGIRFNGFEEIQAVAAHLEQDLEAKDSEEETR